MLNNLIKDRKPKHLGSVSDVATNETQITENQTDEWDTSNLPKHKQYGTMGNLKRSYRKVNLKLIPAIYIKFFTLKETYEVQKPSKSKRSKTEIEYENIKIIDFDDDQREFITIKQFVEAEFKFSKKVSD